MNQDTFERSLDKLASTHTAMLSAVAALLGIIVSATAIIASVGGSKSTLLFPTIVVSFLGVACVLAVFYQQKKEFHETFDVMAKMEGMSREEQVRMVSTRLGKKSAANRLSNLTLAVALVASLLFLTLCAITFVPAFACA